MIACHPQPSHTYACTLTHAAVRNTNQPVCRQVQQLDAQLSTFPFCVWKHLCGLLFYCIVLVNFKWVFLLLFFAVLFAGSAGVISPVSPVAASSDVRQAVRERRSGEIQPTAVPLLAREAPTRCAPRSPVERLFAWRSACACASGYKCV